jgi:hypothetical protein
MRLAAALLALLLAATPAGARDPAPLTRSDLTSLSDEALARRIFGPLAADLSVSNRPTGSARLQGDSWVWFWTRPRKDWLRDGLCVTDRMIVRLTPAPMSLGDNPALRLHSIQADSNYIIRDRKMANRLSGFEPKEREGQDEACASLDPRRDSRPAESGWQLMKALEIVEALGDAARTGRAPVPIDCTHLRFSGPPAADESECLEALSTLRENSIAAVKSCADSEVTGGICIRVQTWDWFLYFVLSWGKQEVERVIVHGIEDTSSIE